MCTSICPVHGMPPRRLYADFFLFPLCAWWYSPSWQLLYSGIHLTRPKMTLEGTRGCGSEPTPGPRWPPPVQNTPDGFWSTYFYNAYKSVILYRTQSTRWQKGGALWRFFFNVFHINIFFSYITRKKNMLVEPKAMVTTSRGSWFSDSSTTWHFLEDWTPVITSTFLSWPTWCTLCQVIYQSNYRSFKHLC